MTGGVLPSEATLNVGGTASPSLESQYSHSRCWALAGTWAACRAAPPAEASSRHGMVVTAQHRASEVGVQILQAGGNAVDAAVAVGYAEAVTNP